MLFEDKESHLVNDFRMLIISAGKTLCVSIDTEEIQNVAKSILDKEIWESEWVDSSGKDDPPPDFYNNNQNLMLEVMRVDDHTFEENGRIKNPTNQLARKLEKDMRRMGLFEENPNLQLMVNAVTDLQGREDHNYDLYRNNFKRIVEKHIQSIPLYRENHPEYKLIFLIFDESSMYCKVEEKHKTIKQGEPFIGEPHKWFYDKAFIEVFKDSGIDYLIWFAPYKHMNYAGSDPHLPMAVIFDCNQIDDELIEYDPDYMMSVEE